MEFSLFSVWADLNKRNGAKSINYPSPCHAGLRQATRTPSRINHQTQRRLIYEYYVSSRANQQIEAVAVGVPFQLKCQKRKRDGSQSVGCQGGETTDDARNR